MFQPPGATSGHAPSLGSRPLTIAMGGSVDTAGLHGPDARRQHPWLTQLARHAGRAAGGLLAEAGQVLGEHLAPLVLEEPGGKLIGELVSDLLEHELRLAVVVRSLGELALRMAGLGERVVEVEEDRGVAQVLAQLTARWDLPQSHRTLRPYFSHLGAIDHGGLRGAVRYRQDVVEELLQHEPLDNLTGGAISRRRRQAITEQFTTIRLGQAILVHSVDAARILRALRIAVTDNESSAA